MLPTFFSEYKLLVQRNNLWQVLIFIFVLDIILDNEIAGNDNDKTELYLSLPLTLSQLEVMAGELPVGKRRRPCFCTRQESLLYLVVLPIFYRYYLNIDNCAMMYGKSV